MRYQGNFLVKVRSSKLIECEMEAVEISVLVLVSSYTVWEADSFRNIIFQSRNAGLYFYYSGGGNELFLSTSALFIVV